MTKDSLIKKRLALIALASVTSVNAVGCGIKTNADSLDETTSSLNSEAYSSPKVESKNTLISVEDRDSIDSYYNKYETFFKDYYNQSDSRTEATYDLKNMISMMNNDYTNISEEDVIRVLRLFQDTKDGIDLKANNYVIKKTNENVVPQTPDFSEFLKDETLKNQYKEIYNTIDSVRVALNEGNEEQINRALDNLNNIVVKIEDHGLDYSGDSYNSSSTIKYLMNSIKYDAECLAGEFNTYITYNDEWNNNPNQKIYLKCKDEKDQAIKDTFDINYIRNNDIDNEDRLEKQIRTIEDVDGNKYETEVKGYYVILEDSTNLFATVQDYEKILDYLAPSKYEDIMIHIYYDLLQKACTTENGLKNKIETDIYFLQNIKYDLYKNTLNNKELVFKF